jgi:hypothetical protein
MDGVVGAQERWNKCNGLGGENDCNKELRTSAGCDYINKIGEVIEALLDASKENGLGVNVNKTVLC